MVTSEVGTRVSEALPAEANSASACGGNDARTVLLTSARLTHEMKFPLPPLHPDAHPLASICTGKSQIRYVWDESQILFSNIQPH